MAAYAGEHGLQLNWLRVQRGFRLVVAGELYGGVPGGLRVESAHGKLDGSNVLGNVGSQSNGYRWSVPWRAVAGWRRLP